MTRQAVRTFLQMIDPGELDAAGAPSPDIVVERVEACPPALWRRLYSEVGRDYHWVDRLDWTDEEIARYLSDPALELWVVRAKGETAGYFELREHEDRSVEIAYFGLLPAFLGRGWGKFLLTQATYAAWRLGAVRVWLHTCTLDHPAALPNYLKRGFRPTREEVYEISGEGNS